jgi:hypothetical protein
MVSITSLWLPILVSSVIAFVLSSVIHMFLSYHSADYKQLPVEGDVMEALRKFSLPPGDYMVPRPTTRDAMRSPEFLEKRRLGPVMIMTVMKPGEFNMGAKLGAWFGYLLLVNVTAAYVAGRALGPGAPYLHVFRFAGCTAFCAYALALFQDSIWYERSWGTTLRNTFDGLLYASMAAGTFGWLWPR